jgi:D-sedoheptulose 7-phosphate isomerase
MIDTYFNSLTDTLDRVSREQIMKVIQLISECKGNIFVFGNGGSASTASHFCQDMSKQLDYKFICLNDNVPCLTAYANDIGYASVFKLQLSKLVEPGDLVIGISCSGNSENVISAIIYAKHFGYLTIGLTGFNGGELEKHVDHSIHVPSNDMQVCEDIHSIITHVISKLLK